MTPEIRAARDRIAAACNEAESVGTKLATAYVGDIRTVLAELDRYDGFEQAALETARHVAGAGFAVPDRVEITYQTATRECEGCGCCNAADCHRGPGQRCPANSLGHSVCPCTED